MNESEYTTPLGTFTCCDCGVAFDGLPRGPKKRRCPHCKNPTPKPGWTHDRSVAGAAARRDHCAGKGDPCPHCGEPMWRDYQGVSAVASCDRPECKRLANRDRATERNAKLRAERLANPQPVDKTGWIQCPYCPDLMPAWRKKCGKPECKTAYNRDRGREYLSRWTAEHGQSYGLMHYPEQRRESSARWRGENVDLNREQRREGGRRRRAIKLGVTGTHDTAYERAQYERQHAKCFYGRKVNPACAVSLKDGYHVEHVIPLAGNRTSSNGPENIVLACPQCNGSKGSKDPMDWAGIMF